MDVTMKSTSQAVADEERVKRPSRVEAAEAVRTLIAFAGDNPNREGMIETPDRVLDAYGEMFDGYATDPEATLQKTFRDVGGYDDIVLVRDIPFHSHCEHHLVPFFGVAHIAYLPYEGVVGLSKLARLTNAFAHRFQTQENLTAQIIEAINDHLNPRGAAVMLEAEHMCMTMRGVKAPGAKTVTHRFTGVFAEDRTEQDRFFAMVRKG